MGIDTSTKAIIAIDIILAMTIAFLLGCCSNLISVGDPNYNCESYTGRMGEGEVYSIFRQKLFTSTLQSLLPQLQSGMNKIE